MVHESMGSWSIFRRVLLSFKKRHAVQAMAFFLQRFWVIVRIVQATKREHVRSVSVLEKVDVVGFGLPLLWQVTDGRAAIGELRLGSHRW